MDQKQKNDSKMVSPTRNVVPGCFLAGLFFIAFIWLVLLLLCILWYSHSDDPMVHNPNAIFFNVLTVTIFCAALAVPVLVTWGICLSRKQKKERDKYDSKAISSDRQICPPPESGVHNSSASQTDRSDPMPCLPNESGGQSKAVSKVCSSILDFCVPLSTACLFIVFLIWLDGILGSFNQPLGLSRPKRLDRISSEIIFATVKCAIMVIPLLVLRGISVDRKRKREQKRNNAESQPRDIPTTMSCGCAAAVGLFWFLAALWFWWIAHSHPGNDPLIVGFLLFTVLCVTVELPLLILWRIFAYRKYRRDQNRKSAQPREPVPRGEAVPAGEADGENEIVIAAAAVMDQQQKNDSKAVSPILNIAEALSCAGAVIVGVIWSAAMINCFLKGSNYLDFTRNATMAWIWGVLEVPLLTLWGVCAQRKHQIAQNINDSKPDSLLLLFAKGLSYCCVAVTALFSLDALLSRFGIASPELVIQIESHMGFFIFMIVLSADIMVPVLFIRNIYAHLQWRKDQNGR